MSEEIGEAVSTEAEPSTEGWCCSRADVRSYDALTGEEVTFIYPPGFAERLPIGGGGDLKQQAQAIVDAINGAPKP